jgi:hypothetical protein
MDVGEQARKALRKRSSELRPVDWKGGRWGEPMEALPVKASIRIYNELLERFRI